MAAPVLRVMTKLLNIDGDYFLLKEIHVSDIKKNDYIALNAADDEYPYWEIYLTNDPDQFHGDGLYKIIASSVPEKIIGEMPVIDFGRMKNALVAQLARAIPS